MQRSLTKLTSLDLFNCPVTSLTEYRSQVFQLLPSLKSLDGLNEKGEEVDSEGEEEDEEEVDEEEEEEEEEEDEEEDGPGLDYLLNSELRSVRKTSIMITWHREKGNTIFKIHPPPPTHYPLSTNHARAI